MLNEQKQTVNVTQLNHLKPMYTFSLSQLIDFFFFLVEAEQYAWTADDLFIIGNMQIKKKKKNNEKRKTDK